MALRILALDPATKTGWAHSCGESGVWDLSVKRDESSGMRLLRLRAKLNEVHQTIGVDFVAFEAARMGKGRKVQIGALSVQSEIQGVIKLWAEENLIQYKGYSSTEIKRHACGNGNASKDAMMEAAENKFNRLFKSYDEVDALWLLDMASKRFDF